MLRTSLILAMSILTTGGAWAEKSATATTRTSSDQAAAETESQQFARSRLMAMAGYLAHAEKFSVNMRAGYEVVQDSGQKIEFGDRRHIVVQRPNHVRIVETVSHGGQSGMLFDGKNITMFDGDTGLYAQRPQPGDIDASVIHFVRDLKMRLPLAPLLMKRFADELQRRIQDIEYVEHTDILGKPAHHIAARTKTTDFQVWITDSKQPLPLRIVLNYPHQEGQPQFWANFYMWNLSPSFDKTTFQFRPPADARQIVFAAELVPSGDPQATGTQNQGGKK